MQKKTPNNSVYERSFANTEFFKKQKEIYQERKKELDNERWENYRKKLEMEKNPLFYNNISYQKAKTVQSGYLPKVDDTLTTKKGICFDYSALMTTMLRTQNIPTKLVIGYAGSTYHAWISVYTEEQGWIDNAIHFDGQSWKFMDPTFASSGKGDKKITEYITNPSNYIAKFSY